ncbi:DUF3995 domain-containing protein [Streptomyces sp. NPDC002795]|uniref:DUF3995 domain-containing protein n=1 Tax=Streptomyces sp. NPDC002795 TaxID=3364665 RepID=UPI0036AFE94C
MVKTPCGTTCCGAHTTSEGDGLRFGGGVGWPATLAAGWATAFACLHFFWALGGERGLAVSAGEQLASERPAWFVAGGLWGVGLVCLLGAVMALALRSRGVRGWSRRALYLLGLSISVLLLARGVLIEVLLITGASATSGVSSAQKFWSLTVWNPWFILGGVLFGLAARGFGRATVDRN